MSQATVERMLLEVRKLANEVYEEAQGLTDCPTVEEMDHVRRIASKLTNVLGTLQMEVPR